MKVIDISQSIFQDMLKYPSDPKPTIERTLARTEELSEPILDESGRSVCAGFSSPKFYSGYTTITARNHLGTHIDAPAHKLPNGKTIDQYNTNWFINLLAFQDLTAEKIYERKFREVTPRDLGRLDFNANIGALILNTGYAEMLESRIKKEGKIGEEERKDLEGKFTYLCKETIEKIYHAYPSLRIIGIDSPSFDPRGSNSETHREMFNHDILPLEGLWNLEELWIELNIKPSSKPTLHSVPEKIVGGDAGRTSAYVTIE